MLQVYSVSLATGKTRVQLGDAAASCRMLKHQAVPGSEGRRGSTLCRSGREPMSCYNRPGERNQRPHGSFSPWSGTTGCLLPWKVDMTTPPRRRRDRLIAYPAGDGRLMTETDIHRENLRDLLEVLDGYLSSDPLTLV